jgi:hypothetical protein
MRAGNQKVLAWFPSPVSQAMLVGRAPSSLARINSWLLSFRLHTLAHTQTTISKIYLPKPEPMTITTTNHEDGLVISIIQDWAGMKVGDRFLKLEELALFRSLEKHVRQQQRQ